MLQHLTKLNQYDTCIEGRVEVNVEQQSEMWFLVNADCLKLLRSLPIYQADKSLTAFLYC